MLNFQRGVPTKKKPLQAKVSSYFWEEGERVKLQIQGALLQKFVPHTKQLHKQHLPICFVHLNKRIIQGCCTTYQNSTFHNISQNLSNSYEFNKCKTIFYNISFILDDACFKITNFSDGTFFLNFHHKKSLQLHAAAIWRP